MKKQIFLCFVIGLSLFNIISFSMQQENGALVERRQKVTGLKGLSEKEMDEYFRNVEVSRNTFNATTISSYLIELMPIVDGKMKRVEINSVCNAIFGSFQEDKQDIAQENVDFLKLIQQYSLESQYKEAPFVLFHGPYGTGKTFTASKFAQLLNKKTIRLRLDKVKEKNNWVLQRIVTEVIEKKVTEDGEPCVFFLDEIDRLLCPYNFDHSDRDALVQNLIHCLSEAQRINREKNQQKYFIVVATNHPERTKEIQSFFNYIEMDNPNISKRTEILSKLITGKRFSFDISALDQNTIENIAKKFEGISIRELRYLIDHAINKAAEEHCESHDQYSSLDKTPLCERHFLTYKGKFTLLKQFETTFFTRSKELGLKALETSPHDLTETVNEECGIGTFDEDSSDDEELTPVIDEEEPRELSFLNFDQQVEILSGFVQGMENADDTFDVSKWDQDLIEEEAKTFEDYSIENLKNILEKAVMIAQKEHGGKYGPIPFLKRHLEQAKQLFDEQGISDQKTEEPSTRQYLKDEKDWLRKKAGDVLNAIPGLLSSISGYVLNSGPANSIGKRFSCFKGIASSFIIIIFHFLLRKPF